MNQTIEAVRAVLQQFQDGYTTRDLAGLDAYMGLFAEGDDIELIGIGASVRGGTEWFEGQGPIREIIESDWTYWGDVTIDVEGAKISVLGEAAWLSTSGTLTQTDTFDEALPFYLDQMKAILESENPDLDDKLVEATHFGMRRVRERAKGAGHQWPFVFTAVLTLSDGLWRFRQVQFAMPVD